MFKSAKTYSHSLKKSLEAKSFFELPEKYKSSFIGKWATFWKNLYLDYKEVAVETVSKAREKPRKAVLTLASLGGFFYCCSINPDERNYWDAVLHCRQELALVGQPIRNPASCHYFDRVGKCLDKGEVRFLSLGLFSFVWGDSYDSSLGMYASQCPYLRPHILEWPSHLLDVGFLGRWWLLHRAMHDFDINHSEFDDSTGN